ncbi:MAG: D-alanine--D-alanine ligase [Bacillota bacterium]
MKKVAVLLGGPSSDREVSLRSGQSVYEALLQKGYQAVKIDPDRNLAARLEEAKPDVVFIALHGKWGEDGAVQGLLEILGLPYTGCDVLASALAMNKITTKKMLACEGISTPSFIQTSSWEVQSIGFTEVVDKIRNKFTLPVVVKAATQGSTIGIYLVREDADLLPSIKDALNYSQEVLVEEYVEGIEITVPILGNSVPQVLPLIEIVSMTGKMYDYEAKYTVGMSNHIIPARIPSEMEALVRDQALRAYRAIGARGFARVDFIVSPKIPYALEINTVPGLTATSLFPDAAKAAGIEFPELVEKILLLALEN